jgi:phage gpG-like protein
MISGTVTGDARVLARFDSLSQTLRAALVESMKRQWFRIQAEVVTGKLSGDPLHRRTGVLASSINVGGPDTATAFTEDTTMIVGRIGTRVWYGAVHENGGTFTIKEHTRTINQAFGRAISPREVSVRAHTMTTPQRSFLRSTLREMRGSVLDAIRADMARAAKAV